jgi:hypothetical protein
MKTVTVVIFSLVIGLLVTTLSNAAGEIYRYRNSQGNFVYSDRKPNTEYEVINGGSINSNPESTERNNAVDSVITARSVADVRAVTDTIKPAIDSLYTQLVASDNESQGNVTVNFTIVQSGNISSCTEDETEMKGTKFNGSICEKIKSLQFKAVASPSPLRLTYTYNFNPAG